MTHACIHIHIIWNQCFQTHSPFLQSRFFWGHLSSFHGHFEIAGEPLCAGTIKVGATCTWYVSFLWGKVIHHCSPSPSCRLVLDLKASVMLVVVVVVVVVLSPLLLLDSFCSNGSNKYGSSYYHAQQSRVKGGAFLPVAGTKRLMNQASYEADKRWISMTDIGVF